MGVQSGVAIPHYFIYHEKRMMKSIEGEKGEWHIQWYITVDL